MKMFKKSTKGFTLVELVIVIAVLAVLAAVAIPVATNIISEAKLKADKASTATYQAAMEMYNAKNGAYPANDTQALAALTDYTGDTALPAAPQSAVTGESFIFTPATKKVTKGDAGLSTDNAALALSVAK